MEYTDSALSANTDLFCFEARNLAMSTTWESHDLQGYSRLHILKHNFLISSRGVLVNSKKSWFNSSWRTWRKCVKRWHHTSVPVVDIFQCFTQNMVAFYGCIICSYFLLINFTFYMVAILFIHLINNVQCILGSRHY